MPIYEFQCSACGHRLERLQKVADADPRDCPACTEPQLKRRVSAPAFRLAGSGWYETDFKSDADRKRNLAERATEPASSAGEGKSDPGKVEAGGTGEPAKAPPAAVPAPAAAPPST